MWFWFALATSIVSAVSVILNKQSLKKVSASLVSWALIALSLPIIAIPAFKDGWPRLNIWPFIFGVVGSSLFFGFAKTLSLKSIKQSNISEVFPLTSFGALFSYILGLIFLGEFLRPLPLLGLLIIIAGSYILKAIELKEDFLKPFKSLITHKGSFIFFISTFIMSFSSVFDKVALKSLFMDNAYFVLFVENLITTLIISGYLIKEKRKWTKELKDNFPNLFINSLIYTFLALLYLWAITTGPIALVSAMKKLEIFFALILGWVLLKDKPTKQVWIGSLIMLLGVALIRFG